MGSIRELREEFVVSADTVRRDLNDLVADHSHEFERYHGGLRLTEEAKRQRSGNAVVSNLGEFSDSSSARTAADLIQDGYVVVLNGGAAVRRIASYLPEHRQAQIITNSLDVALALARRPHVEVVVVGDRLKGESLLPLGDGAYRFLATTHAHLCILSACSVEFERGVSVADVEEFALKRAMVDCAARLAVIVDAETIGRADPYVVAPSAHLTHLLVEGEVPDEALAPFRAAGTIVIQG